MMEEQYLTPDEAAKLLKVHVQTIRRWVKTGELKAQRIGVRLYIRTSDLNQSLKPASVCLTK